MTPQGNWEGRSILHVSGPAPEAGIVERGRAALLAARRQRVAPARDDKQLAAWNGMALRALATGALVLGAERYATATDEVAAFIRAHLLRADGGCGGPRGPAPHTPAFSRTTPTWPMACWPPTRPWERT